MFERMLDFFKKAPEQKQHKMQRVRSFIGARTTRFTNWLYETFTRINLDLDNDLFKLTSRTRELAKNNDVVRAYLEILEKNIIGATGFELQSQIKKANGELDEELNDEIEWAWWDFGQLSNGFLTIEGGMGHQEFDKLILRTLLIDGEVFIRIRKDVKNPYGLSFELIDSMSIDFTKRREFAYKTNAIVLGIEIDKNYKPVKYYTRPGTTIVYQARKRRGSFCKRDNPYIQKGISETGQRFFNS